MKSIEKNSNKKPPFPETEKPTQKTLSEVLDEIQDVINRTHWIETRLSTLKANGYYIKDCWVKNGSVKTIWYMKKKKEIKIQVADAVLNGKYYKAKCVLIPATQILFQEGDESRVRNYPIQQKLDSSTPIPERRTVNFKLITETPKSEEKTVRYTSKSDTSVPEKIIVKYKHYNYGAKEE